MSPKDRFSKFLGFTLIAGLVIKRFSHSAREVSATPAPAIEVKRVPPPQPVPAPAPIRRTEKLASRSLFHLVSRAVSRFLDDDCTTMAAALAYYTTFSIAPLLLIVIAIVGLIFGRQVVQHQIQSQVQGLIGQGPASQVGTMVQHAGQHSSSGALGAVLGALALLVGATGAFTQLQSSFNQIWHVKPDPRAGGVKKFLGSRILSLGMILAIAFLLLVSLAVTAALSALGNFAGGVLPRGFSGPLLQAAGFVVSLAIIAALFAAMFKGLPDAKIRWRDVWIGAGITSVLFTIGKFLIGIYLGRSGTANAYGEAGALVLVVLWIYYSSMILLFGAEFTAVWSEAHFGPVQPKSGAISVDTHED